MPTATTFAEAAPEVAAARLDTGVIHLWRIPYSRPLGRAPLLALLAAYLGVPATAVRLDHDARGKPHLLKPGRPGGGALRFNWSHSGDYALIALALDAAPGVDIERLVQKPRATDIARRYFDPAEADALDALEPPAREHAFIGLWCAKEAVLKSSGEGLSFGLERLVFMPRGTGDWTLARTDPALGQPGDWRLRGLDPAPGYRGALAWRGADREIVALRPPDA